MNNRFEEEITQFIKEKFLTEKVAQALEKDTLLLDQQIIDSSGVLVLIMFIEKKYNIEIDDLELVPENFNSAEAILNMIQRIEND